LEQAFKLDLSLTHQAFQAITTILQTDKNWQHDKPFLSQCVKVTNTNYLQCSLCFRQVMKYRCWVTGLNVITVGLAKLGGFW